MKILRLDRVVSRRALALAFVGVSAVGFISPVAARVKPRIAMSFASVARAAEFDPLASDSLRPTERAFVREASEMARHELRAAQLAVSQGASADVRTFAQQLVTDQGQIIESLNALTRKKGVVMLPPTEGTAETFAKMTELSGAAFDKEFVKVTAAAVDESVKIFERAMNDAKDTEVRELAGSFLPVLRDHSNKVRELKKQFE